MEKRIPGSVLREIFFALAEASKELSPVDEYPVNDFITIALDVISKHPEPIVARWIRCLLKTTFDNGGMEGYTYFFTKEKKNDNK